MLDVIKGSKTDLAPGRYSVTVQTNTPGAVDLVAVLLADTGEVRSDDDLVFFNNPRASGVAIRDQNQCDIDLTLVPDDVARVVVAASTEAQNTTFAMVPNLSVTLAGPVEICFAPPRLGSETVVQLVAFYRRNGRWKLDAVGQGYAAGLAAFATDFGITVDSPPASPSQPGGQEAAAPPATTPAASNGAPINMSKVRVSITKDSPDKSAAIDLRKGGSDWVLTVGLEWDGRGATYHRDGSVKKYGTGDLDVYFFCRDEVAHRYVVLSGEKGHTGSLSTWPFIHHHGDSKGPGAGRKAAVEQVTVRPQENGDLLVNVYQSVDNGAGAIDTFGKPRVAIRYGKPAKGGLPGPDCDEILVFVGNSKNSYWATVAHIDVQDGILKVDGETRYSRPHSEAMPTLDRSGTWVRSASSAPVGRSKSQHGSGLTNYSGTL